MTAATFGAALGMVSAVVNVGMLLYHWRIIRRSRRHLASAQGVQADTTRTLEAARALLAEANYYHSSNGTGAAPEEGPRA